MDTCRRSLLTFSALHFPLFLVSVCVHDHRPGQQVVPAAFAGIQPDPEKSDAEEKKRRPVGKETGQSAAVAQWLAPDGAHPQAQQTFADGLPGLTVEDGEVRRRGEQSAELIERRERERVRGGSVEAVNLYAQRGNEKACEQ